MIEKLSKYAFPVIEKELYTDENPFNISTGLKAIYREDETDFSKYLGYHTEDYVLIPNKEVLDAGIEIIEDAGLKIERISDKWSNESDKNMNVMLVTDKGFDIDGDETKLSLSIVNSYDGSRSYGFDFGCYRMVCSNGLYVGERILAVRRKHVNQFQPDVLREQIMIAMEKFPQLERQIRNLKETTLNQEKIDKLFENALKRKLMTKEEGKNLSSIINGQPNQDMYWMFNLLTYYITHILNTSFQRKIKLSQYISKQMLGM